jgi:hypothetical protein
MHSYLTAFADSDQLRKEKFGANKKVHAKRAFLFMASPRAIIRPHASAKYQVRINEPNN